MPQPPPPITLALLLKAIGPPGGGGGDRPTLEDVLRRLMPVVQARVAKLLWKRAPKDRDPRQELQDMVQDVFFHLLEKDHHALRLWDPAHPNPSSLENWVGFIAERLIGGTLKTKSRSPWTGDPTESDVFDRFAEDAPSPETRLANEELRRLVFDRTKRRLSPLGLTMFNLRWEQGLSVNEICALLLMSRGAVDAWMARIKKIIEDVIKELDDEPPDSDDK